MLKKSISFLGVFSIASGAMISSGIFILPGVAFAKAGPALFISYFIAGVLGLLGIFNVIELATAMPKAGGDYYFINKTFGPFIGTISGFLGWFALSLKSSFAIFGLSEILYVYTGITPLLTGFILCAFFVFLNLRGAKEAVVFQIALVIGLLSLMLLFVVLGLFKIDHSYFNPFVTGNVNDIFITSGFVFISFGGLLNVANIAEEVKNPKKNLPLGMILSIATVTLFYTLITFVLTGTLNPESFRSSVTPVADSAKIFIGQWGYILIIIASVLAFFTTANAGIMSASRYPMALSRDRLMPQKIAFVSKKNKTPVVSIIITGAIIYSSLLLPLELLVKAASTVILTSYVLTNLSVIIMRESKITNYKPSFKAPLYPWLQIACIILFSFFIIDLGLEAVELSLALLLASVIIYIFYGRKTKIREYALLHLLKRITDTKLSENILEDEFREILVGRDDIEQDNFDNLIKKAKIIDIDEHLDFESLIHKVAKALSGELGIPEKAIVTRFIQRQNESNTALSEFLAIPHIIIEGEDKMFLTIIRARNGISFTETENNVQAVFLLGGTKEKRMLHVKTLAAIATLVGLPDFKDKWLALENIVEIKNLLVLNDRKRFH